MNLDRTKQGMAKFVAAQSPRVDYLAMYAGTVVAQRGANSFDFQPDDPRIPSLAGIPIKLPFPGFSLTLDPSANSRALLGWVQGDPAQPELRLWEAAGLEAFGLQASQKVSLVAPAVNLGSDPGAEAALMAETYRAAEDTFFTTLITALTTAGAALTAAGAVPTSAAVAPAGAALTATSEALVTFQAATATYLSQVVKNS